MDNLFDFEKEEENSADGETACLNFFLIFL